METVHNTQNFGSPVNKSFSLATTIIADMATRVLSLTVKFLHPVQPVSWNLVLMYQVCFEPLHGVLGPVAQRASNCPLRALPPCADRPSDR